MEAWVGAHPIVVALLFPRPIQVQLAALVRDRVVLLQVLERDDDISVDLACHLGQLFVQTSVVRAHVQGKLAEQTLVLLEQEDVAILVALRGVHSSVAPAIASLALVLLLYAVMLLEWLLRDGLDHDWVVRDLGHWVLRRAIHLAIGCQMRRVAAV